MRVVPGESGAGGAFHLEPTGACARCGAAGCGRYAPTPMGPP